MVRILRIGFILYDYFVLIIIVCVELFGLENGNIYVDYLFGFLGKDCWDYIKLYDDYLWYSDFCCDS